MENKENLKSCLSAIDEERKATRKEKIMWIVSAALQAACGTYSFITNGWQSALLYIVIVLLTILLIDKADRHDEDLRMLGETIEMTQHMHEKTMECLNMVHQAFEEAMDTMEKSEEAFQMKGKEV